MRETLSRDASLVLRCLSSARSLLIIVLLIATSSGRSSAEDKPNPQEKVSGDSVIRAHFGNSEIVITTTSRLAGAIHSLTWNGKEFIDSADHGRQLQSASNYDAGARFTPETFNPTEAGSVDDGAGPTSSSRLLHLIAKDNLLQTTSRMAFWLLPTGESLGNPAKNATVLSDHLLTKRVRIGHKQLPNVISYDVTFSVPLGEKHSYAQFETVTGYMPAEFDTFWRFNPQSKELEPLSDGPGEQPWPVILATSNGAHAMGIIARDPPGKGMTDPGYGRFRFPAEKVVKWNCVYRMRDEVQGIPATDFTFRQFVIVGDLAAVKSSLIEVQREPGR